METTPIIIHGILRIWKSTKQIVDILEYNFPKCKVSCNSILPTLYHNDKPIFPLFSSKGCYSSDFNTMVSMEFIIELEKHSDLDLLVNLYITLMIADDFSISHPFIIDTDKQKLIKSSLGRLHLLGCDHVDLKTLVD